MAADFCLSLRRVPFLRTCFVLSKISNGKNDIDIHTLQLIYTTMMKTNATLSFPFRNRCIPVTLSAGVTREEAELALKSQPFVSWYQRCEKETKQHGGESKSKKIEIDAVEIQSVDLFGAR